jgi:hypothetical protein
MKKLSCRIIIIVLISFLLFNSIFSVTYTPQEISTIEGKINSGAKLTEAELIKYVAYQQDEIIKLKEANLKLLDSVVKEKNEKIEILQNQITQLEKEKDIFQKLIESKDTQIQERQLRIDELEREIKDKAPTTYKPKTFTFEIGLSGGYDFLYMNPIISLNLKPSWYFCDWFGLTGRGSLVWNFQNINFSLQFGFFVIF